MRTDDEEVRVRQLPNYGLGRIDVSIAAPMIVWLIVVFIGFGMALLSTLLNSSGIIYIGSVWQYILELPGDVILPLITGIWISEHIGRLKLGMSRSVRLAVINAIYAALIYAAALLVMYVLISYAAPSYAAHINVAHLVIYSVAIPISVLFAVMQVFTVLSVARRP